MVEGHRIKPITREWMSAHLKQCVAIDAPFVAARLLEQWGEDAFLYELPAKWELSCAICCSENVVAYRVASLCGKMPGYAHSHRTAVTSGQRGKGWGTILLQEVIERAKGMGCAGLTGMRHPWNEGSRRFLLKTGWRQTQKVINGNELWVLDF